MHPSSLPRTSPEQQGVASSAILQFIDALESQVHEIHSFMLLRHGSVIAEGWWSPYKPEYPHMLYSVTKSFTSTAVGLAVSEGRFSLDDPVISFFPGETPAEVSSPLAAMTVRHLLSMSTGHADDSWAYMQGRDISWVKAFLDVPVPHAPGSRFLYDTGASYMLSAIVQKTTGLKLIDYLNARLFEPLGIDNAAWLESPEGVCFGGYGLNLKTEDVARFGQLYLQKGRWHGRQVIAESWVAQASSFQIANGYGPQNDWAQGYGYQFWRCRHDAYRADGVFGQFCIVMPQQDAVLALTGGIDVFDSQIPLDLVWKFLLPAMQPDAMPDDPDAHERLTAKLSALSYHPVQGQAHSPTAAQVSGQTYSLDANELNVEALTLTFDQSGSTVTFKTASATETFPFGIGTWQRGQTSVFNNRDIVCPTPTAASGAWTSADCFTMVVRLVETPYVQTMDLHFDGDDLLLETRVNVSLDGLKPLLLTGHAK